MSAAVNVVSLTIASDGEVEVSVGDGCGVAAAAAVAVLGFVVAAGNDGGLLVLRMIGLGLVWAATTVAIVNAKNKTKGAVRFIECMILVGAGDCQLTAASCFTVSSVSISSAVLSRRSLTMRGNRKA